MTINLFVSCYPPICYFSEELDILIHYLNNQGVKHTYVDYKEIDLESYNKIYILFNVHAVHVHNLKLPKKYIVLQFEQYLLAAMTPEYLQDLKNALEVWDYSKINQEFLKKRGVNSTLLQIGYDGLSYRAENTHELDVLFIGSPNTRRNYIINYAKSQGLDIMMVNRVWKNAKYDLVNRAKININIHFETVSILETVRLMSLLSHGCFVITEKGLDKELNNEYEKYCIVVDNFIELVEKCKYYLNHQEEREKLQDVFYNNYKNITSFGLPPLPTNSSYISSSASCCS